MLLCDKLGEKSRSLVEDFGLRDYRPRKRSYITTYRIKTTFGNMYFDRLNPFVLKVELKNGFIVETEKKTRRKFP